MATLVKIGIASAIAFKSVTAVQTYEQRLDQEHAKSAIVNGHVFGFAPQNGDAVVVLGATACHVGKCIEQPKQNLNEGVTPRYQIQLDNHITYQRQLKLKFGGTAAFNLQSHTVHVRAEIIARICNNMACSICATIRIKARVEDVANQSARLSTLAVGQRQFEFRIVRIEGALRALMDLHKGVEEKVISGTFAPDLAKKIRSALNLAENQTLRSLRLLLHFQMKIAPTTKEEQKRYVKTLTSDASRSMKTRVVVEVLSLSFWAREALKNEKKDEPATQEQ